MCAGRARQTATLCEVDSGLRPNCWTGKGREAAAVELRTFKGECSSEKKKLKKAQEK